MSTHTMYIRVNLYIGYSKKGFPKYTENLDFVIYLLVKVSSPVRNFIERSTESFDSPHGSESKR